MLKCKDIVTLVSTEEASSWRNKLPVRFHLAMCRHCRRYVKQLDMMKDGVRSLLHQLEPEDEAVKKLEEHVLERID